MLKQHTSICLQFIQTICISNKWIKKTIVRDTFADGWIVVNIFIKNQQHTKRWQGELTKKNAQCAFCHIETIFAHSHFKKNL